jgi:DNA-binding NarL/FixJ family response regulator
MKAPVTEVLLTAIQTVMAGGCWVGLNRVPDLFQYLKSKTQAAKAEARTKTYGLTHRELEVISGVVAGMSNNEIASYFKIAEDTVKHHLSNIFDKLGVSKPSVITSKAANGYHFKTGQRDWPSRTENVLTCRLLWWQVGFGSPAPRAALEHVSVVQ